MRMKLSMLLNKRPGSGFFRSRLAGRASGFLILGVFALMYADTENKTNIQWKLLINERQDNTWTMNSHAWHQQILDDLRPFADGISEEMIIEAVRPDLIEYIIYENKIYYRFPASFGKKQHHETGLMLLAIMCSYTMPDLRLIQNINDGQVSRRDHPLPVFSFTKSTFSGDILYPYWSFLWLQDESESHSYSFNKAWKIDEQKWKRKKNIAIWRGSTTGGFYSNSSWKQMKRTILVEKCKSLRDLCDAMFVDFPQTEPGVQQQIQSVFGTSERLNQTQMYDYKYLIILDGNFGAASRVVHALASGSLVLLQETQYYEFFYYSLRPYIHYIPLSKSLEDLESKLRWVKANDEKAKIIVQNSMQWAAEYVNRDFIDRYYKELLSNYASLQKFEVKTNKTFSLMNIRDISEHFFARMSKCKNRKFIQNWAIGS